MVQRPGWIVAAVVAAIVIVVEAPILLGGQTWAAPGYQTAVVPSRAAAGAAWADGRAPEWWDGSGLGVPLAAEPAHGAIYPPLALVGLGADPLPVIDALIVLHVLLAAIGLAAWARRRYELDDDRLVPLAIAAGGAALGASGVLHAALLAGGFGVAWLPWVAWAAEGLAVAPRPRARALVLAAMLGATGLAGPPGAAIDGALLAAAIALAGAGRGDRRATAGLVAAAIAAGAAACAAAWVPAVLHRTGDVAAAGAVAPTSTELLGWLAPAGAARFHLGGVWFALAAIAVLGAPRRAAPLAAIALGIAGTAFGPAITAADPAVHLAAASIALCGLGVGGLVRVWRERPGAALAAIGAAAVVIAAALAARHVAIAASIGELVAVAALLIPATGARAAGLAVVAALALCGPGLLAGRAAAPLVGRAALLERPVLAPPVGARVYRPRTMATDTAGPPGRAVRIDPDTLTADAPDAVPEDPIERARDDHATVAGDIAARFGAASAQSADPGRQGSEDAIWFDAGIAGGRLLDRYAIGWAILPTSVIAAQRATPAATRGRWALAEQRPARGRAFVAARARGAATVDEERRATFPPPDERATPLDTVVIAGGTDDPRPPSPPVACAITAAIPERVDVSCPAGPAGWAVIADAWAPGWTVTVDGAEAEVVRADALLRAVRVGPGEHAIAWCYRTPGLRAALLVSGLAWLHLAFGAWLVRRRRRAKVL